MWLIVWCFYSTCIFSCLFSCSIQAHDFFFFSTPQPLGYWCNVFLCGVENVGSNDLPCSTVTTFYKFVVPCAKNKSLQKECHNGESSDILKMNCYQKKDISASASKTSLVRRVARFLFPDLIWFNVFCFNEPEHVKSKCKMNWKAKTPIF